MLCDIVNSSRTTIEFYDLNNLDQTAVTCKTGDPGKFFSTVHVSASSPSTLWYTSWSIEDKVLLGRLDCTASPSTECNSIEMSHCNKIGSLDMCFVGDNDKMLVITAQPTRGLIAFNIQTRKIQWAVIGRLKGEKISAQRPSCLLLATNGLFSVDGNTMSFTAVTTDGRGHIFACDVVTECVYVFYSHGGCLVVLLGKGRYLWGPRMVRWCDKMSSLVVLHKKNEHEMITFLRPKKVSTSVPSKVCPIDVTPIAALNYLSNGFKVYK